MKIVVYSIVLKLLIVLCHGKQKLLIVVHSIKINFSNFTDKIKKEVLLKMKKEKDFCTMAEISDEEYSSLEKTIFNI